MFRPPSAVVREKLFNLLTRSAYTHGVYRESLFPTAIKTHNMTRFSDNYKIFRLIRRTIDPSNHPSTRPSIHSCVCPSIRGPTRPHILHTSVSPSMHLYLLTSVSMSVHLFPCPPTHPCVQLSLTDVCAHHIQATGLCPHCQGFPSPSGVCKWPRAVGGQEHGRVLLSTRPHEWSSQMLSCCLRSASGGGQDPAQSPSPWDGHFETAGSLTPVLMFPKCQSSWRTWVCPGPHQRPQLGGGLIAQAQGDSRGCPQSHA